MVLPSLDISPKKLTLKSYNLTTDICCLSRGYNRPVPPNGFMNLPEWLVAGGRRQKPILNTNYS